MENYSDIIGREWTGSPNRPHMTMEERAKIFLPFAALKGHEEAIEAKKRITVKKIELSEDMKENLDRQFQKIMYLLENNEHPMVTMIYFVKEKNNVSSSVIPQTPDVKMENSREEGEYLKITGMVGKLDINSGWIQVVNKKINFNDIRSLLLENEIES